MTSIYNKIEKPRSMVEIDELLRVIGADKISIFYPLGDKCTIVFSKEDKRSQIAYFLLECISNFEKISGKNINNYLKRLSKGYPFVFGYAVRMDDDYDIPGIGIRIAKERMYYQIQELVE